jgi:HD-GYP domain-containing protein (c-di-GMP phosphodiesterase class II)
MGQGIDKKLLVSLMALASVVELRDPYTGGHLWRVGNFSRLLAERIGLDRDEVFRTALGGFLHDLGKVGVPDGILRKSGALTEAEFGVIKAHPAMGAELLRDHPLAELAHDAVLSHHERADGGGYPSGRIGDATPLVARIVGLADAFDAMTSTRSYRPGMPIERALAILDEEKGRQFDAGLVDAFVTLGRNGDKLAHIAGHSDRDVKLVTCPNCGPIIAVERDAADGDITACRNCAGLVRLHRAAEGFSAELIGFATLERLRPIAETAVFDEFIADVPRTSSSFFLGRIGALVGRTNGS